MTRIFKLQHGGETRRKVEVWRRRVSEPVVNSVKGTEKESFHRLPADFPAGEFCECERFTGSKEGHITGGQIEGAVSIHFPSNDIRSTSFRSFENKLDLTCSSRVQHKRYFQRLKLILAVPGLD
jgi:hypothetical protein